MLWCFFLKRTYPFECACMTRTVAVVFSSTQERPFITVDFCPSRLFYKAAISVKYTVKSYCCILYTKWPEMLVNHNQKHGTGITVFNSHTCKQKQIKQERNCLPTWVIGDHLCLRLRQVLVDRLRDPCNSLAPLEVCCGIQSHSHPERGVGGGDDGEGVKKKQIF